MAPTGGAIRTPASVTGRTTTARGSADSEARAAGVLGGRVATRLTPHGCDVVGDQGAGPAMRECDVSGGQATGSWSSRSVVGATLAWSPDGRCDKRDPRGDQIRARHTRTVGVG